LLELIQALTGEGRRFLGEQFGCKTEYEACTLVVKPLKIFGEEKRKQQKTDAKEGTLDGKVTM
jgi:hypothetical protein